MATTGVSARNKGNSYERKIAGEFRALGWLKTLTSRLASKLRDDEKVDLVGTDPFNIQCKAVESAIKHAELLEEMPKDGNINVIFHKRNRKELVILFKKDFYKLIIGMGKDKEKKSGK